MTKLLSGLALSSLFLVSACASNGQSNHASTLSVEERVMIAASAHKVWSKVNSFGDLGAWHPAVASIKITSGSNNQQGAVRLLTLQDGGTITETLTTYSTPAMTYSYVIKEGVLPVSQYASTIQVIPQAATSSEVVWKGNFKRKDQSANQKEGQDDARATSTIKAVYGASLENLKK